MKFKSLRIVQTLLLQQYSKILDIFPTELSILIRSEEHEAPHVSNSMQTDEIVVEENIIPDIPEEKEISVKDIQEPNPSAEFEEMASDQNNLIINEEENNNQNIIEPKILEETLGQQIQEKENENFLEIIDPENFEDLLVEEENIENNDKINIEDVPLTFNLSVEEEENRNPIEKDQGIPNLEESSSMENPIIIDEPVNQSTSITQTTTPKSTSKSPYYPQFMLSKIPLSHSFDEISILLDNELQKHGEVFKLEKKDNSESSSYDVLFSFAADKNAVIALKSPIWIDLGNNENNIYRVKVEPTPGFIKYLTDLSSSMKLQSATKSNSSPQKETKSPPLKNEKQNRTSESKSNKEKIDSKSTQKKSSTPKKEIPLEIVKVHKRFLL